MTCKSKISSVGIAAAMHKPEAVRWARQFACRLAELGVAVRLAGALQDHCQGDYGFGDEQYLAESDLVIVLGGDGSLLLMARSAAPLARLCWASMSAASASCHRTIHSMLSSISSNCTPATTVSKSG